MTAKRFTVKQRQGATIYSIEDYYGELPLNEGMYYKSNAEKLCEWLNTQQELLNAFNEENEQLRTALKELKEIGDYQADRIQELSDENEQLKKALWCIRKRYGYTIEEFVEDLKDNGTDLSKVDLK